MSTRAQVIRALRAAQDANLNDADTVDAILDALAAPSFEVKKAGFAVRSMVPHRDDDIEFEGRFPVTKTWAAMVRAIKDGK